MPATEDPVVSVSVADWALLPVIVPGEPGAAPVVPWTPSVSTGVAAGE